VIGGFDSFLLLIGFLVGWLLGDWRKGREEVARAAALERGRWKEKKKKKKKKRVLGSDFRICLS
jgi:hypothetical protein